ncbi:MAG: phenylalanine-4-hydroxylase [Candidatus Azotimanducaceae bacterium]|jgi:phenylalanine-4-hydroxylase
MGLNQKQIISELPLHLQGYVEAQNYESYSPQDHALWRFLMGRLSVQLAGTAHLIYLGGLKRVGINREMVPDLEVMNAHLAQIGWQVLGVTGFIPPPIFMEFQSRCILPIALRMRSIEQIFYTPAPDILHESAGHAPLLIDVDYAEFLQQFGKLGTKALNSKGKTPSEASKFARLHWWTIEYGLVGTVDNYKLFGAGLLSSLSESANCLDDKRVVKKLLTVDAICQDYDITHEQPLLFVTHSCQHMRQVLDVVAQGMCQFNGRAESVREAISGESVCTLKYSSGLQVSGIVSEVITDQMDNAVYVRTAGPTQLAWRDNQLPGHGGAYHANGFGSPVGRVNEMTRCLSEYTIDELDGQGIRAGDETSRATTLEFLSGITVSGVLIGIERREQKNILFSFANCTVLTNKGGVLFDPAWGQYDMALGAELVSVSGGAADRSNYQIETLNLSAEMSEGGVDNASSMVEPDLIEVYGAVREMREAITQYPAKWRGEYDAVVDRVLAIGDWLVLLELYEITLISANPVSQVVYDKLVGLIDTDRELKSLVNQAVAALRTGTS